MVQKQEKPHLGTESVLGYPVTYESAEACVADIVHGITWGCRGRYFVCANPHSMYVAESDDAFKRALKNADIITPDGVGVLIASKWLGGKIRKRVTGSDIFSGVCTALNKRRGIRMFFLGSTEEVLRDIRARMALDYPNIEVVGLYSPPYVPVFSKDDNDSIIEAINGVKPDVVWVGLTAPKQEKWIYDNKDKLNVKFLGAIGAVFDFYVGRVKRSSLLYQRMGLEWLPRLLREPKRLWRRNFISNPAFMFLVLIHLVKSRYKYGEKSAN